VGQEEDTQGSYQTKDISDWSWEDFAQYLKDLGGDQSCPDSPSNTAEGRNKDTEIETDRERQLYWRDLEETPSGSPKPIDNPLTQKYSYIQGDLLNFCNKLEHFGPTLEERFKIISDLTHGLTNGVALRDPKLSGLTRQAHPNVGGQKASDIMAKGTDLEQLSQREVSFVRENRGYLYSKTTEEIISKMSLYMKAISTEELTVNNWNEIQKGRGESDCKGCQTSHPESIYPIESVTRNVNGPIMAVKPLPEGDWRAVVLGIVSFMSLPWSSSSSFLNLGFTNPEEYDYDLSAPLKDDVNAKDCPLGCSILDRIELLPKPVPIFLEFSNERGNRSKNFMENIYNFLRVVRALQKLYGPPILVILGFPLPGKQDSNEEYLNLKRRNAENANLARYFAHFMGVGLVENFTQRKPCLSSEGYEWLNFNWNLSQPLFNKHLQPTPECHRRAGASLEFILEQIEPLVLGDEVKGARTD
jgi:hypothetical protein